MVKEYDDGDLNYICEVCNEPYSNFEEALLCEKKCKRVINKHGRTNITDI